MGKVIVVAAVVAAVATACTFGDPSAAPPTTVRTSSECAASIEGLLDAHKADGALSEAEERALYRLTLTACPTAREWLSAALKYPKLTGIADTDDGAFKDKLWQLHCFHNHDTPACTDARERGLYEIPETDPPIGVDAQPR